MRNAFDAALDEVARRESESIPPPLVAVPPVIPETPAAPSGRHSLWEFAAAWTPEADPPPPSPDPPPPTEPPKPSVRLEDIAAELNLGALRVATDVAQARRRFMWDNHPDRRRDLDRDTANRRVALANMLLDRTLARLKPRARRPAGPSR